MQNDKSRKVLITILSIAIVALLIAWKCQEMCSREPPKI